MIFKGHPPSKDLQKICDRMIHSGADVVKIATFAQSYEDNLHLLSLIPYAKKKKPRNHCHLHGREGEDEPGLRSHYGSGWTYASLGNGRASAPGQLTVQEMTGTVEKTER